jgi:hypothetical protein
VCFTKARRLCLLPWFTPRVKPNHASIKIFKRMQVGVGATAGASVPYCGPTVLLSPCAQQLTLARSIRNMDGALLQKIHTLTQT